MEQRPKKEDAMSTTRDWMRGGQEPSASERRSGPLRGALVWVGVVALTTFVVLALQQTMG
jgi:hypothetical protein